MLIVTSLVLVTWWHTVASDVPSSGPINFLTTEWDKKFKFALRDDSLTISCQTDQPYATVELYRRELSHKPWQNVAKSLSDVIIISQTFLIKELTVRHSGRYKCVARNWNGKKRDLVKGQLVVTSIKRNRIPEIFPDQPSIRVDLTTDRNITCKAIGAPGAPSFLTWYRKMEDGSLVKVHPAMIHRESQLVGGNNIDIDTLMFKYLSDEHIGEYVCQRKVYNSIPTRKSIKLIAVGEGEAKPVFKFETQKWILSGLLAVKMALVGDFLFISCQTSTPYANVNLTRRRNVVSPWEEIVVNGRIQQIGQTFLMKKLSVMDTSYYKCTSTNDDGEIVELEKGLLVVGVVKSDDPPEITPKVPILRIKRGEKRTVVCKTNGIGGQQNSFLQWYRKNKSGNYIYVKKSKVVKKKEYVDGVFSDTYVLEFQAFGEEDVGEYVCERKIFNEKATQSVIRIEMDS